jgi:hypothetical protein
VAWSATVASVDSPRLVERPDLSRPWRLIRHLRRPPCPGHTELVLGRGLVLGHNTVALLMWQAGMTGLPMSHRPRWTHSFPIPEDLVDRNFTQGTPTTCGSPISPSTPPGRGRSTAMWCWTPSREKWWAGPSTPHPPLLWLPTRSARRSTTAGPTSMHADHGTQFTSWVFTDRAKRSACSPPWGLSETPTQLYGRILLGSHAGRAPQPSARADPSRTRKRHVLIP